VTAADVEARGRHLAIFLRSLEGGGGAERMMVTLAGSFVERGHRVDLVLGSARGALLARVPEAVRVVELGRRSFVRALPALLRDPASAARLAPAFLTWVPHWVLGCIPDLAEYLEAERPDAMLSALNYSNIVALWAHRLAGVPTRLVVSERNTLTHRARVVRRNARLPSLVASFYPWADAISAVSDGVADDLAAVSGIPRERITTTYNPVVGPEIEALAAEPLDDAAFARPGVPVILAAGKLKKQKGFDALIDAFALLRARRPAQLVILGEGELRRRLGKQVRRLGLDADVSFPGFVENPFPYMAAAATFVLSSRWEGLPGVLIQAMACGCPVVSTDCQSGPREILADGRYGELVPVGDPRALALAIERSLDVPGDPEPRIARVAEYSVDRATDRYLSLLLPRAGTQQLEVSA
jgi:glycosyltransferase involved in cell wall biosynthesis